MIRQGLRGLAIGIAIAGAIDPAFTAERRVKPDVSLVAAGRLPDPALVDRVARALGRDFTVIRGDVIGAAAVVSVGFQRPALRRATTVPSFAVLPAPTSPFVSIASISAPPRAHLDAQVPVRVRAHVVSARGRTLRVTLLDGAVPLQSVVTPIATDDAEESAEVSLVTSTAGAVSPTVRAEVEGTSARDEATLSILTGVERRAVLVFDTRPSWLSTFVRRALEGDPRFVVTSRIQTSRASGASAGRAPVALAARGALDAFDAVVIGAPNGLTPADASALDAYMRTRRGRVILLQDEAEASALIQRLTGITRWSLAIQTTTQGAAAASEFLRPAAFPAWAKPTEPALSIPVGPGRLYVNVAIDAWRHRGAGEAAFDRTWRAIVAEAAEAPIDAEAAAAVSDRAAVAPDERDLLRAWTTSRGGAIVSERDLDTLAGALTAAVDPSMARRVLHPMRSAWWMLPFGLALGGEWWLRRRHGAK